MKAENFDTFGVKSLKYVHTLHVEAQFKFSWVFLRVIFEHGSIWWISTSAVIYRKIYERHLNLQILMYLHYSKDYMQGTYYICRVLKATKADNTNTCFVSSNFFLVNYGQNQFTKLSFCQAGNGRCGCIRLLRMSTRVARWYVFKPKIKIWVNFGGPRNEKSWYILWPFGLHRYVYYGPLVI
jgi:hypothetical protein